MRPMVGLVRNGQDSGYILGEELMGFAGILDICFPRFKKLSHYIPQYEYSIAYLAIPYIQGIPLSVF